MSDRYSTRAVEALLRVSEIEDHKAREALLLKQRQVRELEIELSALRKRRDSVIRRGGAHVLHERLLLDALLKIALKRNRELKLLEEKATLLLETYREANQRKKAVSELRERLRLEREMVAARRGEEAAGDLAATSMVREHENREGES